MPTHCLRLVLAIVLACVAFAPATALAAPGGDAVPPAPTGLVASDGTYAAKVRLTWNASAGATSYRILRRSSPSGWASWHDNTPNTWYDDTDDVTAGHVYYYAIEATSGSGYSAASNEDTGYRGYPTLPTGLAASDGSYADRVMLTWNASSYTTYYRVYRAVLGSETRVYLGDAVSVVYQDTTAARHTTYTYWIRACNNDACSSYSSSDTGQRLSPPTVTASDGTYADRVQINWTVPVGATYYQLYVGTSEQGYYATVSVGNNSYGHYSAEPGTVYYYWVTSCNPNGCTSIGHSVHDTGYRALSSATATATATPTRTRTSTPTRTYTPGPSATASSTPTVTPTSTRTPTATRTSTAGPSPTWKATWRIRVPMILRRR